MLDLIITFEDKESSHRLIVGRAYYEPYGMDATNLAELVFTFLLQKKVARQTEGMRPEPVVDNDVVEQMRRPASISHAR